MLWTLILLLACVSASCCILWVRGFFEVQAFCFRGSAIIYP